jgi:anaerobic magnesium-protoporphyrin IX monomethyl ester cyclase
MATKLLFVEPPKDYWFLMGEYLPPPTALLALAAYVERELKDLEIEVLDCQAEKLDWKGMEQRIASLKPDIVAASGFTCNAYVCAKVAQVAKTVDPGILTVIGGQHFSSLDEESLRFFPEIDLIVRGEGERTLVELIKAVRGDGCMDGINGLSFRHAGEIRRNPDRELIEDLNGLPYPAYHLVEGNLNKYHFKMMSGKARYLILEGSRGCAHRCSFCTQWRHWKGEWRTKTPQRVAEEMAYLRDHYGGEFLWLTDDNFEIGRRGKGLAQELKLRGFKESTHWFFQARSDDIAHNPQVVSQLQSVGNSWQLIGVENGSAQLLKGFKKGEKVEDALQAVKVLKYNGVLAQAMVIIGSRKDTAQTILQLREFVKGLDVDMAIFTALTPMPGTEVFEEAKLNGWIEDWNYANYDMAHAIMPTETLSRMEVQRELYHCYKSFFGSPPTVIKGMFSSNEQKKKCYRHLAGKRVLTTLRHLI